MRFFGVAKRGFIKDFFTLAAPIFIGNILTWGVGFIDHVMTVPLGASAASGIFLSNQIFILLGFLNTGIEATLSIVGSQALGEGNKEGFYGVLKYALLSSLIISAMLAAICAVMPVRVLLLFTKSREIADTGAKFLRILAPSFPMFALSRILAAASKCLGAPKPSLILPLSSLLVNLPLNLLLIRGVLSLGVTGAAISTLAARSVELTLAVILLLFQRKTRLRPKQLTGAKPRDAAVYLKALAPIMLGQIVWSVGSFFTTAIMSQANSGEAVRAFGAVNSLANLAYTLMNGASAAVGIIISRQVGSASSKEERRENVIKQRFDDEKIVEKTSEIGQKSIYSQLRRTSECAELTFLAIGGTAALLILMLGESFLTLFNLNLQDKVLASQMIPLLAVTFFGTCYSAATLFGIIKSGGDLKFVLIVDLSLLLFCTLPLGLLLYARGADAALLFFALRAEHLIKCPIAHARCRRGNWSKRLTRAA